MKSQEIKNIKIHILGALTFPSNPTNSLKYFINNQKCIWPVAREKKSMDNQSN